MDQPFDSPRMLMVEAEECIARLKERIEAFVGEKNWAGGGVEIDRKTGEKLCYVQFPTDIPAKISLEIRAVARDLRDALDHAVYASSVALFGGDPKRTKFLIADKASGIQDDINRGRCKDVHQDIIALMENEEAHEAGNRTLWALNQFRNRNTHKVVTLAHAGAGGFGITNGTVSGTLINTMSEWHSARRRLYFARFDARAQLNFYARPRVQINLHPIVGMGRKSAIDFLREAVGETGRIIDIIEQETTRIAGSP